MPYWGMPPDVSRKFDAWPDEYEGDDGFRRKEISLPFRHCRPRKTKIDTTIANACRAPEEEISPPRPSLFFPSCGTSAETGAEGRHALRLRTSRSPACAVHPRTYRASAPERSPPARTAKMHTKDMSTHGARFHLLHGTGWLGGLGHLPDRCSFARKDIFQLLRAYLSCSSFLSLVTSPSTSMSGSSPMIDYLSRRRVIPLLLADIQPRSVRKVEKVCTDPLPKVFLPMETTLPCLPVPLPQFPMQSASLVDELYHGQTGRVPRVGENLVIGPLHHSPSIPRPDYPVEEHVADLHGLLGSPPPLFLRSRINPLAPSFSEGKGQTP